MSIRSDSPIDSVERSWKDIDAVDAVSDSVQLSDDRKELRAHFFLAKQDADEIVFLQAPGSAKIEIEIVSGRRFSVAIGDRFPFTADHYETVLDPAEKPYRKKTVRVNPFATRPMVLLWYAPPPTSATFLDDKTEEIEEQLRSLGYIE